MSVVNFSQIFVILHTMCVVNLSQKLVNLFFNFIHNFVQISIICALICSQKWPIWQPWAINNLLAVTVRLFTGGGCHSLLWPNEFFSHIVWNGQFLTMCWRANAYIPRLYFNLNKCHLYWKYIGNYVCIHHKQMKSSI